MFKPGVRRSKRVSGIVSVTMPKKSWDALLIEIGEWSPYYKVIKKQLPVRKQQPKLITSTKTALKIESEKSPLTRSAEANRVKQILNRSVYEKIAAQAIVELKIPYTLQKQFFYGTKYYLVDIYLPNQKLVIELDGSQHYTPEGIEKDEFRTQHLLELGVNKVLRIPNNKCNTTYVKKVILEAIDSIEELEIDKI